MSMIEELAKRHPDVDRFLLLKWERVFNAFFDRNCSAEVDWGDFYLVVRQVRDIYGADSDQMRYARSSMKALWEGLVSMADKNQDELIQIDEWINVLKNTDPSTEPKWFVDYVTFMFKLFDVSADELLDLAEYTDGMMAYGFTSAEAHECFKKFAIDPQGNPLKAINFSQFKECWNQYFYSKDKNSLGNYLFGRYDTSS